MIVKRLAAGYAEDGSVVYVGVRGICWSASVNESNCNNGWNFNFNANDANAENNNNRYYGLSVRAVRCFAAPQLYTQPSYFFLLTMFVLTRAQLLEDLKASFLLAIRHKHKRRYVRDFVKDFNTNINSLCDELWNHTYSPQPSTCFIISDPKIREVFAAAFRDRIVHHLYFLYVHEMFERTFIADCYSCIKKRGTHYGIDRLDAHIRSCSENYTKPCYILKMDIKGYFMNIDRQLVCDFAFETLDKMKNHKIHNDKNETWGDIVDIGFLKYLSHEIALVDPTINCIKIGNQALRSRLPKSKSLFTSPNGCGLPIGNLTSQLFSNLYLNKLDQYVKRVLKCKHYGRYVDDLFVVSNSREHLHQVAICITNFVERELRIKINKGKTKISTAQQGVEFLGAYLKPGRRYISNQSLRRIKGRLFNLEYGYTTESKADLVDSINSYLGVLSHYSSFNIANELFGKLDITKPYGYFKTDYSKFIPYDRDEHCPIHPMIQKH